VELACRAFAEYAVGVPTVRKKANAGRKSVEQKVGQQEAGLVPS